MSEHEQILQSESIEARHQCIIYQGPPSRKLLVIAKILKQKLDEGYRCLYLNSTPMVAGMRSTLAALNVDVTEITKHSLILSSDPVSSNGQFNIEVMLKKLEDLLDEVLNDGYKGLWASGDMTWEFGPANDFSKLMEYELALENLFRRRKELCGICQYHQDTIPQHAMRQSLLAHPTLVINETLKIVNPHYLKSGWPADLTTCEKLDDMIAQLTRQ